MSRSEPLSPLFDEFPSIDLDEWRATVREELGDAFSEDLFSWSSPEGVSMRTYLHRSDLENIPHVDSEGSLSPLTEVDSLPANDWRIRQTILHPDPQAAKEHAQAAIEGGVTDLGLSLFADGFQEESPVVKTPSDLATMIEGVDPTTTALHFETGLAGIVLFGAFKDILSAKEGLPNDLRGSISYDPVAALARSSLGKPERAFDIAEELVEEVGSLTDFRPMCVDARVYHNAGASAVEEVAFTIGALSELLARGTERGLHLSTLLDALQLIVPVSTSYFVEIAKLRALRLLVPQVIDAYAEAAETDSSFRTELPLQAETSRRTETLYDPYANLLRATTEAMAAILGGCDVLSVRPYDAALQSPDAFSARLARNTQLILQHEAHLDQVADPAAGSYYLEAMTDQIAQKAWSHFQELEANGGLLSGLQDGTVQKSIETTRRRRHRAINERTQVLVGTTHYPTLDERRGDDLSSPSETSRPSPTDLPPGSLSLHSIQTALQDGTDLPTIVESIRPDEPTLGPLPSIRLSEPIEALRLRTEQYAEAQDGPPTVLLVPMGPVSARSARATFARNFLGVAGFEIIEPLKFETPTEAATKAVEADADVVVLCSADDEYDSLAPAVRTELGERDHEALLVIAGHPDQLDDSLSVDAFVYQNAPLRETLEHLQEQLGMTVETSPRPAHT